MSRAVTSKHDDSEITLVVEYGSATAVQLLKKRRARVLKRVGSSLAPPMGQAVGAHLLHLSLLLLLKYRPSSDQISRLHEPN